MTELSLQCMAYIHNPTPTGTIMDATEYARIADLIRQISLKIEDNCHVTTSAGHMATIELHLRLDNVLRSIDHVAWMDNKGLL